MSFRAIMLMKSRDVIFHKANAKKSHFKFGDGIYIISIADIQNREVDGTISGAEAIYFEGNPHAVGYNAESDNSGTYLDEIVTMNALKQTASGPNPSFGNFLAMLAPLKDPITWVYLLFGGAVLWGILAGAMGWV